MSAPFRAALCAALLCAPASARSRPKALVRDFEAGKTEDRVRLAPALGRLRERKATDALLAALDVRGGNPRETAAIVAALGEAGDARAAEPLAAAWDYLRSLGLQMGELPAHLQTLRAGILESLAGIGGERATSVLEGALGDADPRVVRQAIKGLGRLQVKAAVPALRSLAGSGGDVTQAVLEALGEIGDSRGASTLEDALKSGDRFVEVEAAYGLARMGRKGMTARLESSLKADPGEEKVALLAAHYLARLDRASGLEHLEKAMTRRGSPHAVLAAESLGKSGNPRAVLPLVEASRGEDPALRLAAAVALGRLGGTRAVGALKALRQDQNPSVRSMAAASLARLGELE